MMCAVGHVGCKARFEEAMQGSGNFEVLDRFLEFGQSKVNG